MPECQHVLKHLQAPCGCCIDCPSKAWMLISEPTEKHMAEHEEFKIGIIHSLMCGIPTIEVPLLKYKIPTKIK